MIRAHLLPWRHNICVKNKAEYLEAVKQLPEQDRQTAVALWNSTPQARLAILNAMHEIDMAVLDGVFHHAAKQKQPKLSQIPKPATTHEIDTATVKAAVTDTSNIVVTVQCKRCKQTLNVELDSGKLLW